MARNSAALPRPHSKRPRSRRSIRRVAALVFETSGTTSGRPGRHSFETRDLYDAALLAAFDRFMLPDGARLRYFNLVPNPAERPQSSLGYMMARVCERRGDGRTGWYVRGDALALDEFFETCSRPLPENAPVCIAATRVCTGRTRLTPSRSVRLASSFPLDRASWKPAASRGAPRVVEIATIFTDVLVAHLAFP